MNKVVSRSKTPLKKGQRGLRGGRTKTQSVLFDKRLGWSVTEARQWLKDHNLFSKGKVDSSGNFHKFRMFKVPEGVRIRTIDFSKKEGIKARIVAT